MTPSYRFTAQRSEMRPGLCQMRASEKTLIPGQADAICPMRASERWLRFVCGPHQVLDVASGAALRPFVQLFGSPLGLLACWVIPYTPLAKEGHRDHAKFIFISHRLTPCPPIPRMLADRQHRTRSTPADGRSARSGASMVWERLLRANQLRYQPRAYLCRSAHVYATPPHVVVWSPVLDRGRQPIFA